MFSGVGGVKIHVFVLVVWFVFAFKFLSSLLQLKKEQNRERDIG